MYPGKTEKCSVCDLLQIGVGEVIRGWDQGILGTEVSEAKAGESGEQMQKVRAGVKSKHMRDHHMPFPTHLSVWPLVDGAEYSIDQNYAQAAWIDTRLLLFA